MTAHLRLPYTACIHSLLLLPDFQIHFQQNPVQKHSLHKLCLVVHQFFFSLSQDDPRQKHLNQSFSLSLTQYITQDKSITYICSVVNPFSLSLSLSLTHTHTQDESIPSICSVVNLFSLSLSLSHTHKMKAFPLYVQL